MSAISVGTSAKREVSKVAVDGVRPLGAGYELRLTPIAAVILIAATRIPLRRWADFDVFWHLSNGRLMVRDGISPSPDQYSWSGAGRDVALHYVQADRLLYLIWQWNGTAALSLLSAVMFAAALLPFALLIGRLALRPIVEAAAILFLAITFLPYIGARPHLLGVWLLGVLALLVERPFGLRKATAAAVSLGLWVNLHGSFPLGFVLVGLAAVLWAIRRDLRSSAMAMLAFSMGASAAALSPVGLSALQFDIVGTSHPVMSDINSDWVGLRPFSPEYAPMSLLIVAAVALGVWRGWDARTFLCLPLVLVTIQYARFTVFAAPLLMVVVLERLVTRVPSLIVDPKSKMGRTIRAQSTEWFAWSLLTAGVLLMTAMAPSGKIEDEAFIPLPETAVAKLMSCGTPSPIWNDFNWGGYITWKSDGQYLTSIDARSTPTLDDLFPAEVFNDYIRVQQARAGWEAIVQDSPSQYALVPNQSAPIETLPGWRLVYKDSISVLSVRDGAVWNCPVESQ